MTSRKCPSQPQGMGKVRRTFTRRSCRSQTRHFSFEVRISNQRFNRKAAITYYFQQSKDSLSTARDHTDYPIICLRSLLQLKGHNTKGQNNFRSKRPGECSGFRGRNRYGVVSILYVDNESDNFIKVGRILVAIHPHRPKNEVIQLPEGTRSLYLSEQEPEITYVEKIVVSGGAERVEKLSSRTSSCDPVGLKRLEIPERLRVGAKLMLRGFYRRLELRDATAY